MYVVTQNLLLLFPARVEEELKKTPLSSDVNNRDERGTEKNLLNGLVSLETCWREKEVNCTTVKNVEAFLVHNSS
jgi:hypothetical protein